MSETYKGSDLVYHLGLSNTWSFLITNTAPKKISQTLPVGIFFVESFISTLGTLQTVWTQPEKSEKTYTFTNHKKSLSGVCNPISSEGWSFMRGSRKFRQGRGSGKPGFQPNHFFLFYFYFVHFLVKNEVNNGQPISLMCYLFYYLIFFRLLEKEIICKTYCRLDPG